MGLQDVSLGCGRSSKERRLRGGVGTEHLRICGRGPDREGRVRGMQAARAVGGRVRKRNGTHMLIFYLFFLSNPAPAYFRCSNEDEGRLGRREEECDVARRQPPFHFFLLLLLVLLWCPSSSRAVDPALLVMVTVWLVHRGYLCGISTEQFSIQYMQQTGVPTYIFASAGTVQNDECGSVTASDHFGRPEGSCVCFGA